MNFFRSAIVIYLKKPLIIIYFAIVTLIISLIGLFNPLSAMMKLYDTYITDSVSDTIVLLSKEVYKIGVIPYIVLGVLLGAILLGVLSGLIYSGYFNMIFKSIKRRKPYKTDITDGIKKYFVKVSYVFFEMYLALFGLLVVTPLALVPYIVVAKKAAENGTVNFLNTTMFAIITIVVLLVITLFIIVNFIFKIPSIYYFEKKPIEKAKATLSMSFWSVFVKVTGFFAILVMAVYLIYSINIPAIQVLLNFVFGSIFFSLFSIYMFYDFSKSLEKLRKK